MATITYIRGTTLYLTHNYTAPQYLGATLLFTVKTVAGDTDATDTTNAVMSPKRITMSGSIFPQTTTIKILPTDVAVTMPASKKYFFSIKIIDSNGDEYLAESGDFVLQVTTTNKTS